MVYQEVNVIEHEKKEEEEETSMKMTVRQEQNHKTDKDGSAIPNQVKGVPSSRYQHEAKCAIRVFPFSHNVVSG
jgi:hypothetical protein